MKPDLDPARARELLRAAYHALRSYEYGNSSPDLARDIADRLRAELAEARL